MDSHNDHLQIFLQSPELNLPSRVLTLTLNPSLTLQHLKLSLFPHPLSPPILDSFYFTFHGKILHDNSTINESKFPPFSTLTLRLRGLGGGGDGGATGAESRDCYLNMYTIKKPDKPDPNEKRLSKWTNCALSFEPLNPPCVVDPLGNIFNKISLVEGLLGKKLPKEFNHIKGLKDMIPIHLSTIPGLDPTHINDFLTRFQCPISGLEFNGKYKFFALKRCGHVLSAKALKEVKSSFCLVCHEGFTDEDKIMINGSQEEVAVLRERMDEEKFRIREKRGRKVKNNGIVGIHGDEQIRLDKSHLSGRRHGNDNMVAGNGDSNGSVKRFKAVDMAPAHANKEVYASIFTSSRKSDFKETYSCRSLPLGRN